MLWTLSGRISAAASGFALNIVIGNFYSVEGLGVFNQALAVYMIAILFTVFGINTSVLKYSAEFKENREKLKDVLSSSMVMVLVISTTLTLLLYGVLFLAGKYLKNQPLVNALNVILLALPFFSLNKILVALLNGLRRMKLFAIIPALRWIIIIGFAVVSIFWGKPLSFVLYGFVLAECFLFLLLLWLNRHFLSLPDSSLRDWWKTHLVFGSKTFFAVALNDLNRRIDILMVGFFLTNEAAGLYSFGATAARGFLLIGQVLRGNFNPIASNLWANNKIDKLKEYTEKLQKNLTIYLVPLLTVSALAYPFLVRVLMKDSIYMDTWVYFLVLLIGVGIMLRFNWSSGMLMMANFLDETLKVGTITLFINIIGNILLIPAVGIIGAALATSLTYLIRIFFLRYYIKTCMGIKLF